MSKSTKIGLLFISGTMIFFSVLIFVLMRSRFMAHCAATPVGSTVAGYPIEGLSAETIESSLNAIYDAPIQIFYEDNEIQLRAKDLGLELIDTSVIAPRMKEAAGTQCSAKSFLRSIFSPIQNQPFAIDIPCHADEAAIRQWLETEIKPRYDTSPVAPQPNTQGIGFYPGQSGREMNIDAAVNEIAAAFCSASERTVKILVNTSEAPAADLENLAIQIRAIIDQYQDSGQITEVALIDPKTDKTLDIARRDRQDITPEISFTAASTIKVPVMISSFIRIEGEPDAFTLRQLSLMITESKNEQTDWMMENHVGGNLAPLTITDDMHKLGLKNTFLAGYFYLGAPLLQAIETAANQRTDVNLKPDRYNQTTAIDMATLMNGLYHCATNSTGILIETFPDEITQSECKLMVDQLKHNKLPYLITAGLPDFVEIAHKHGWIEESDGLLRTMSNIAIVYSPDADYILSIFTYHPTNLIFENGSRLFAMISSAVYNYYNPSLVR